MGIRPTGLKDDIESIVQAIQTENLQLLKNYQLSGFNFAAVSLEYDPFSCAVENKSGYLDEKQFHFESQRYKDLPKSQNLLLYSVLRKKAEVVDFILENSLINIDAIDNNGVSALNLAIHLEDIEIAKRIVFYGANLALKYVDMRLSSTSGSGYEVYHGYSETSKWTNYFMQYRLTDDPLISRFSMLLNKDGMGAERIVRLIEANRIKRESIAKR